MGSGPSAPKEDSSLTRASGPSAFLAGALMGAATLLLLAAWVPYLPLGERLATVPSGDVRHAPLVGIGLLLLVGGFGALAILQARAPRRMTIRPCAYA